MELTAQQKTGVKTSTSRQPWIGIALVWLAVALPFLFLYTVSHRTVINEVRHHVKGVAIASAAGVDASMLPLINDVADMGGAAFGQVQAHIAHLIADNSDLRFIYIMRRSTDPFAPPHQYVYIVDAPARDANNDDVIGPDEVSMPPGTPYDASDLPAMIEAWDRPSADTDVSPDPPYPDVLSGYAPIRDAEGKTIAIIGVDVTARTVAMKMRIITLVILVVWLLISLLITLIIHLYYQQRGAFEKIKELSEELGARHDLLRRTNLQLFALKNRNPDAVLPPAQPRMLFNTYYLRAAQVGREPGAVFDVDRDHVGFYLASVSGAHDSESLVGNLVRIALATLAQSAAPAAGTSSVYVDMCNPAAVLRLLGVLVAKELPEDESVSLAYGVLDLNRNVCEVAVAGHALSVLHWPSEGRAEVLNIPSAPPLRQGVDAMCETSAFSVRAADRILFIDVAMLDAIAPPQETAQRLRGCSLLDQIAQLAQAREGRIPSALGVEVR